MLANIPVSKISKISRNDGKLIFNYGGLVFEITKSIHNFNVCIDVSVDGISMNYNNDVTPEDVTFWLAVEKKLFQQEDKIFSQKQKEILNKLRELKVLT